MENNRKVTGGLLKISHGQRVPKIAGVCRVLIRSLPINTGYVWFDIDAQARENWCWPLDVGDEKELALDDLDRLDFVFENPTDRVVLIYEVER